MSIVRSRADIIFSEELKYNANIYNMASCAVYAFVEATLISGPACVYNTPSASRTNDEPTTLQIATTRAPFFRASFTAASVSAVSPDWLIAIISVERSTIGSR